MANRVLPNYQYGGPSPSNFVYDPECPINQQARIIPDNAGVCWRREPMPQSTVKHLYDGPLNYGQRFILRPQGTLYDHDFVQTHPTGLGRHKVLAGGHYLTYPLTNRHVREARDYTSYYFPKPQWGQNAFGDIFQHPNEIEMR